MSSKNIGVYIHIPFCERKCKYCDFLSFEANEDLKKEYVSALISQIENTKCEKEVDSVFIGGGTPSSLSGEDIKRISDAVYKSYKASEDTEFTIEINPATVDKNKLSAYREAGVNRISMGVQSFLEKELKTLGRLHTAEEAEKSFYLLSEAGFLNINLDLMFALPNQTLTDLEKNLKAASELSPTHLSVYGLIVEEGTPIYDLIKKGSLSEADEDLYASMYDFTADFLEECGYEKYEISNFSKKGFKSRHNLKYWSGDEYLGFGLGAVGFSSSTRYENTKDIKEYIKGKPPEKSKLKKDDLISEFLITSLRKTDGFFLDDFKERFNEDFYKLFDVSPYIKGGFMEEKNGRLFFTKKGEKVSNEILLRFV